MPRSIQNSEGITLRLLLNNTYQHFRNRFEYKDRDVLQQVIVKEIHEYSGASYRKTYKIESRSYPQYRPYNDHTTGRQRKYRHEYLVVVQMDELSLDTDRFKIRTGSDAKWDFTAKGRSKKNRRGKIIEGSNIKRGINGDHFFVHSWLRRQKGILYGRNYANGPPSHTNPHHIVFLTKHEIRVIEFLVNNQIIGA